MRVGIAKPEWGITGGFELVVDRVAHELRERGHTVDRLGVDAHAPWQRPFGVAVPAEVRAAAPEFFRHLAMLEAFRRLDVRGYDAIVSTQPPSYAVESPRHLALFSHHARAYYDLEEMYIASGYADPAFHGVASRLVRAAEAGDLARVAFILAASHNVAGRLRRFNDRRGALGVYYAGSGVPISERPVEVPAVTAGPLLISRNEFPKRTELFVLAMKRLPHLEARMIGGGGRLDWVRRLDEALSAPGADLDGVDERSLWVSRGDAPLAADAGAARSNVRIDGHVPDSHLLAALRDCLCVVAPAYDEDYGLTAVEAMLFGKPVVVCSDGGGLCELVEDGRTGLVVEPRARAIAGAVQRLDEDRDLAHRLGAAGMERARGLTWDAAMRTIEDGLERVTS